MTTKKIMSSHYAQHDGGDPSPVETDKGPTDNHPHGNGRCGDGGTISDSTAIQFKVRSLPVRHRPIYLTTLSRQNPLKPLSIDLTKRLKRFQQHRQPAGIGQRSTKYRGTHQSGKDNEMDADQQRFPDPGTLPHQNHHGGTHPGPSHIAAASHHHIGGVSLRDLICSCDRYTSYFNNILRDKIPQRDKASVLLVIEKMRSEHVPMDTTTFNLLLEKVADLNDNISFVIYDEFKAEAEAQMRSKNHPGDNQSKLPPIAMKGGSSNSNSHTTPSYDHDNNNNNNNNIHVYPDVTTFQLMIRACERTGDYRRAFHIYHEMTQQFCVSPDVALYNTLIGYCAPLREESTASFFVDEMKKRNVEPDVHTYNYLMNVFQEAPFDVIVGTFEDMIKGKLKPNRRSFNTIMRAAQRCGECTRVFSYFEEMKRQGIVPDVVSYNLVLQATRDRLDEVLCIPQSGEGSIGARDRDESFNFGSDLGDGGNGGGGRTRYEQEVGATAIARLSMALLAEMKETKVDFNTFTMNTLLGILSRCGDVRMLSVFQFMQELEEQQLSALRESGGSLLSGLPLDVNAPVPKLHDLEKLLDDAIARRSLVEDTGLPLLEQHKFSSPDNTTALSVPQQLQQPGALCSGSISSSGVRPNLETYSILIEGTARIGHPDESHALYEQLLRRGIAPDRNIFIKLIDACAINKDPTRAQQYFDAAVKQHRIAPNEQLTNALLSVLSICKSPRVFEVFYELRHDLRDTSGVENAYGNGNSTSDMISSKLGDGGGLHHNKPNQDTYNIMLCACLRLKDKKKAMEFYVEMCDPMCVVTPDIVSYGILLDLCAECQDVALAAQLILDMKKRNIPCTANTYARLMKVFVASNDAGIHNIFEDIKQNGPKPNLEVYATLLQFHQKNRNRAIIGLFEEMKHERLEPDVLCYNILLKYFAMIGDQTRAYQYFNEMQTIRQLKANVDTYNALMEVLMPSGDEFTARVFDEMDDKHIPPDHQTWATLIKTPAGRLALEKALRRKYLARAIETQQRKLGAQQRSMSPLKLL